ncbi:2OG-Fe dioxygenase family protein [Vibrio sp. WXL103]|uniref:2OG-Fe dioxygenase family protein n=1 Tax=Vibrio sp. WXL103 TaxID=3450710 RepID=UPI003EC4B05D
MKIISRQDFDSHNAQQLKEQHYQWIDSDSMLERLNVSARDINLFRGCWEELALDEYMADGGRYRYRRYGQLHKAATSEHLVLLPHAPYMQSDDINPLNGGVKRHFKPLTDEFVTSPVLEQVLLMLAKLYDQAQGQDCAWHIALHPYRIMSTFTMPGKPTPEGLHRDGVTYIASMLIRRSHIQGGSTKITDNNRQPLKRITLNRPLELLVADDAHTMHEVSPIEPARPSTPIGVRDVLVIAFTKREVNHVHPS